MSLNLYVIVPPDERRVEDAGSVVFEDDGAYWFLHPLFEEIASECGKYIDLYGDVVFGRDDFGRLRRLLRKARTMVDGRPDRWQVRTGARVEPAEAGPAATEIHAPVDKKALLALLDRLELMVGEAERRGGQIVCMGD